MAFKMSNKAQTVKIYNLRADTSEFIGGGDAYIPPHTGLPAHCTMIAPPDIPNGCIAVFDESKSEWAQVEDHRGQTVYDIKTGTPVYISEPGALPEDTVTVAPTEPFQKWDGKKWVKDTEREQEAQRADASVMKSELLAKATNEIAPLQDAADLGIATEEETRLLAEWKQYRVMVNRVNPDLAPDIEWPPVPQ